MQAIQGGSPAENAATIRRIFAGESGPRADIVVINAAAALVASGIAANFREGATLARAALASSLDAIGLALAERPAVAAESAEAPRELAAI